MQKSERMPNSTEAPDEGKNVSPEAQFISRGGPGVQVATATRAHKATERAPPALNGSQHPHYVYALGIPRASRC